MFKISEGTTSFGKSRVCIPPCTTTVLIAPKDGNRFSFQNVIHIYDLYEHHVQRNLHVMNQQLLHPSTRNQAQKL